MPKDEIKFDELDSKFFEEFPLIVDVFTSTVNKINQFLIPYHEELLLFVEQEISNHKGWSISEKGTYSKRQIPFTNESRRKFSLEQDLVARYETCNCISIVKMDEKKVVNYFNLVSGFYFEPKYYKKAFIYFSIFKDDDDETVGGAMNSFSFYESLLNERFEIEIKHKEKGDYGEDFFISIYELSVVEINEAFTYYRECLMKYFKNIKW